MMGSELRIKAEIFKEVLQTLEALKGRMLLALVGIVIGTAAVIAMLHVGYNAKRAALQQFDKLGTDQVLFQPLPDGGNGAALKLAPVLELSKQNLGIDVVSAIVQSFGHIQIAGESVNASILAATDGIYATAKAKIAAGRLTSDLDGFAPFVTIGSDLATSASAATGTPAAIGMKIEINGQTMTVVGILRPTPVSAVLGIDLNKSVVAPFKAARRIVSTPEITQVAALLSPDANAQPASDAARDFLERHYKHGLIQVVTARQLIDTIETQMQIYSTLILGIGAVSLVVGGVGIMNVMLMSVIERRQEIGLRIALGARRKDIRLMFLTETLILSVLGSMIGVALGYIAGRIFASFSGWQFEAAPLAVPLASGMALVVGLFFGIYPATRAARLDPVAALRSEG